MTIFHITEAEGCIQVCARSNNTQTIRTDNTNIITAGNVHYFLLQTFPTGTQFSEAGANNNNGIDSFFAALPDYARNRRGRGCDNHQIQRVLYRGYIWISSKAENLFMFMVNGVQLAFKSGFAHVYY